MNTTMAPLPTLPQDSWTGAPAAAPDTLLPAGLRWACLLLTVGILILLVDGSWRMGFIQRAQIIEVGEIETFAPPDWKVLPMASRLAVMGAWLLVFASAVMALLGGAHRVLPPRYLIMYGGMWFVSGYLLIGWTSDPWDTLSTSRGLFGKMAPGTLLGLGVFFLAAHPGAWNQLKNHLLLLTAATCIVWLAFATRMTHPSRAEAYRWVFEPTLLLEALALLPLGFVAGRGAVRSASRLAPLLLLAAAVILLQARLLLAMLMLLVATYGFLRWRAGAFRNEQRRFMAIFSMFGLVPAFLLALVIAWPLAEDTLLGGSARGFWQRRAEDTRLVQIRPFFEKATPLTLLAGAGYPAANEYNAEGAGGIDMGYLNTMYVTGLPMVALLVMMMVAPVVRCLRLRLPPADAAVVAVALAYCVRLTSSTIPALSAQFLVACLLMGRCAYLLHASPGGLTEDNDHADGGAPQP